MKTIAFVPARCGSKSISLKNIKDFCGKPLIFWNLSALQASSSVDEIYVATDCNEIADTVNSFNLSKVRVYFRSEENATDTASTESVMLEFIAKTEQTDDTTFILVQATSPFTSSEDFEAALKEYRTSSCDSLLSCAGFKRFFWKKSGEPINYDYRNRPRRQDFEGELVENGAFYIHSVGKIKSSQNRLSGSVAIYEMEEFTLTELDEPHDWIIAEALMRAYRLQKNAFPKIKLFLTDVDGVLTDAGMYYSEHGDELKKFSTYDGKGIEMLREQGIKTGIITGEDTQIVARRAKKLKVDHLFQGIKDKLTVVRKLCEQESVLLSEIAFIGDDVNDLELLREVGLAACPANARPEIKNIQGIIQLPQAGGEGAVRAFAELILKEQA